ncbi:MAG: hypothetical protein ACOCQD_01665 [archaeon]
MDTTILIFWLFLHGVGGMGTAEFSSEETCISAGEKLKEKNQHIEYICTDK